VLYDRRELTKERLPSISGLQSILKIKRKISIVDDDEMSHSPFFIVVVVVVENAN
jgi:hypothetical protein